MSFFGGILVGVAICLFMLCIAAASNTKWDDFKEADFMSKVEILNELLVIRKECKDVEVYDQLTSLIEKLDAEING